MSKDHTEIEALRAQLAELTDLVTKLARIPSSVVGLQVVAKEDSFERIWRETKAVADLDDAAARAAAIAKMPPAEQLRTIQHMSIDRTVATLAAASPDQKALIERSLPAGPGELADQLAAAAFPVPKPR